MSTIVITQITPLAIVRIGWRVFITFAALFVPTLYIFFPETMVRNL